MKPVLIRNGTIVTLTERSEVLSPGYVVVDGETIVKVGSDQSDISNYIEDAEIFDATGCLVLPGLINGHTHAPMTLFRGLADDLPLRTWLEDYIFPAERKLTEEWVYWGAMLACAEMLSSGTTTFCDMYLFEHKVAEAVDKAGMRAVLGEVLYDFPSPHYGPIEKGFQFTEHFIRTWDGHERINVSVDPHAVYTCSPKLLKKSFELAERYNTPLVIHLAETEEEVLQSLKLFGKTPVKHLKDLGILRDRLVADHCVVLHDDDIEALYEGQVKVVHNPESNLKLASGIAPVGKLVTKGLTVCLGTDGCASNNDLDMFSEMDTCAKIHKGVNWDPTLLPAIEVLKMATVKGGMTLGIADRVGRIEEGLLADLIVVDMDKPHLIPCYDPLSHLVYTASGSDVRDVMIHGRWVMKNREILTIDLDEVFFYVRQIAGQIKP